MSQIAKKRKLPLLCAKCSSRCWGFRDKVSSLPSDSSQAKQGSGQLESIMMTMGYGDSPDTLGILEGGTPPRLKQKEPRKHFPKNVSLNLVMEGE